MKEIVQSKYSRFFLAGLALNFICAWFSAGFHHVDEHFQVLEFGSYRLGNTNSAFLPWEFQQKIRESLLPGIVYVSAKIMQWAGVYNPFTLIFILRLLTGIASWYITCKLCLILSKNIRTPIGEKLFIMMSLFLWFVPYIAVRFTSENISCIAFLYGVYLVLNCIKENKNQVKAFILAGLLFGVAFYIRIQIIAAIAGFIAWSVLIQKTRWKYIFAFSIAFIAVIGITPLLDYWFYGTWTFSPLNYFYICIVQHEAARVGGTSPWWFYFLMFIKKAFPPISLLLLFVFFTGLYKNTHDPMRWAITPFIFALLIIGHKEFRYLFPVTFIFIYLTSLGLDYFLTKDYYIKIHRYVYTFSIAICIPLLLFRMLVPANVEVNYFKYIYYNVTEKNPTLFCLHSDYYCTVFNLRASFYNNTLVKTVSVDSISEIKNYLEVNKPESALFLSKQSADYHWIIEGYKAEMVYCYLPSWIVNFDTKNWIAAQLSNEPGTQSWHIYRFTRV